MRRCCRCRTATRPRNGNSVSPALFDKVRLVDRFTTLELQVFAAMRVSQPEIADVLGRLLGSAKVTSRENTGFGFFTNFDVDRSLPPASPIRLYMGAGHMIVDDLMVTARDKLIAMSFILHRDIDAYPVSLEGYQAGFFWRAGVKVEEDVDLLEEDLAAVVGRPP